MHVLSPSRRLAAILSAAVLPAAAPVALALLGAVGLALASAPPAAAKEDPRLARARSLVDAEEAEQAVALLDQVLRKGEPQPETLVLRSTARVMLGDLRGSREDLQQALELDPSARQAWLNLAGLEIVTQRYDEALAALRKAEVLDPEAVDNGLNLGAVQVLRGELDAASEHFARYLEKSPGSAEAYYLVAANYALAGHEAPAVDHLRRAVELDEHMRLRARSDTRFVLLDGPEYRRLLATDVYRPPADARTAAAAFEVPYARDERRLLDAVLGALGQLGLSYDPRIEATDAWAIIWGEMRIKLFNQADGTGVVSLSAPGERFGDAAWRARSQAFFHTVNDLLER